jgi:hypothetical protein
MPNMWVQEIDTLDGQQVASQHLDRYRWGWGGGARQCAPERLQKYSTPLA